MGMKSRLFASAAFPLLSLSMALQPIHAMAAASSVEQVRTAPAAAGIEVAQEAAPGGESEEELLKKRHKQQQEGGEQQQAPAEQPQAPQAPAAEQPAQQEAPAEKPRRQREPAAEEAAPQQQQEAPAEKPRRQRQQPAEEAAPQQEAPAEKPRKKRQQVEEAAPQAEQAAPQQEAPAEKPRKKRQPAEEAAPQAEPAAPQQEQAAPQEQPAEPQQKPRGNKRDKQQQQEAKPQAEQPAPQAAEPQGEAQPGAKAPVAAEGEQPVKPRKKPTAAEAPQAQPEGEKPAEQAAPGGEKPPLPEEKPAAEQAPANPEQPAGNMQQGQQVPAAQPNGDATAQPPAVAGQTEQAIPAPEKITPKELERRKEIAADPSKSTETVVLPVENGAAVLDSDKDADRSGGVQSRRDRDRQRGQEQNFRVPKSDADAQVAPGGERRPPIKIEAVTSEQGERLDRRPQFERPDGAQFGQRGNDNRVIIQFNNQTYVRGDDDRRFLRDGERPIYEQLPRDRYRETIDRDGYQIVTVRNRYGDIIQRSRVDNRGRESVLYYSPGLYDDPDRSYFEDPGADLPPMRLRIPLRDYIMDTSSDDDRDYYDFLREPPVEPVERVYSLDEVKYSARIRDKVRRIDLDTITFATGSSEIPMSQARSLRKVADAINEVLRKDPSETFLIEGHTDAVGSDQSNLVLSDQRAESVANVMTDVYGIPPENLATQGYGERYLKVNTQGPNQENRRVTIRRVTALVRPVASRN
ncbi:hypothetical protein ASE04_24570 [Rhizobium sp. Root708]|uniref:OmpA family protein n=1 Tax=Rhizobium sp. Root708 TaxID=1736592 RepID=UPI0006FE1959|nr:OmpA family protein [Rhizobium sp. Root708]KRB60250.1 hypothetical protein ASE04_24570 [Rhizobium sp. Root708]